MNLKRLYIAICLLTLGLGVQALSASKAYAAYSSVGIVTSINLLSGNSASAITNFHYTLTSLPGNSSVTIQFSQDNATWYSAAGVLDASTTLATTGGADVNLSALGWSGNAFYYKIQLNSTTDLTGTPVIGDVRVDYTPTTGFGDAFSIGSDGSISLGVANARFLSRGAGIFGLGFSNATAPVNGLLVQGNVGIGTTTPGAKLTVAGDGLFGGNITPTADGVYDLGSSTVRWNNIYANNIIATGTLNLGFAAGSIVFASSSGALTQNNSQFFWNTTNNRLGIGTSSPLANLFVQGSGTNPSFTVASSTGAAQFTVLANGNVGIGTSTPAYALDVNGAVNIAPNMAYRQNGTWVAGISGSSLFVGGSLAGDLQLGANANGQMVIRNGGNVGIGTSTPNAKLEVTGRTYLGDLTSTNGSNNGVVVYTGNSANANKGIDVIRGNNWTSPSSLMSMRLLSDGSGNYRGGIGYTSGSAFTEAMTFINSGNVGIGTTTPTSLLSIASSTASGTTRLFGIGTTTDIMTVLANGNVGIGTTAPGTLLSVSSATGGANLLSLANTGIGFNNGYAFAITTGKVLTITGGGSSADALLVGGLYIPNNVNPLSGNVGINDTTPTNKRLSVINSGVVTATNYGIHVQNTTTNATTDAIDKYGMYITSTGAYTGLAGTATNNYGLYVNTPTGADNNYAAVFAGGNVGIGTTTPGSLLTVAGNGLFAGNVMPAIDATYNLGSAAARWNNVYALAMNVSNLVASTTISDYFTAASSTATSNFAGGMSVGNGSLLVDAVTGVTSIANAELGNLTFDLDAGQVSWTDLPITALSATGTIMSYTAQLGGNPMLTVYGEHDGTGNIQNAAIGIGTTTPTASLSVIGSGTPTTLFSVGTTTNTRLFNVLANGNIGIGTSTPPSNLFIQGFGTSPNFTVASSTGASQFTILSNGNIGIGTSTPSSNLFIQGFGSNPSFTVGSSTGGTQLTVLAGGNVGIGTSTPDASLGIWRATSNAPHIKLSGSQIATIYFGTSNVSANQRNWDITTNNTTFGDFSIRNSTASGTDPTLTRFYIDRTGNVGIGTTTPVTKFEITDSTSPTIRLSDGTTRNVEIRGASASQGAAIGTVYNAGFSLLTNSVARMTVLSDGNIAIGTSSPDTYGLGFTKQVTVSTGGASVSSTALSLVGGTTGSGILDFGNETVRRAAITGLNGSDLSFSTNNTNSGTTLTERMRITSAGNVGIGSTTPGSTLSVIGMAGINAPNFTVASSSGATQFTVLANGNIGVGTVNPTTLLQVAVPIGTVGDLSPIITARDTGRTNLGGMYHTYEAAGPYASGLAFQVYKQNVGVAEALRITNGGNVGIGTSTPNSRLSVQVAGTNDLGMTLINSTGATISTIRSLAGAGVMTLAGSTGITNVSINGAGTGVSYFNGGNVGIGTTTPSSNLFVQGFGDNPSFTVASSTGDAQFTVLANGNVGVGTSTATQKLTVAGNIQIAGGGNGIYFPDGTFMGTAAGTSTGITSPTDLSLAADDDANGSGVLTFATRGAERMRIDNGGNIGIGTTTPFGLLTVASSTATGLFPLFSAVTPGMPNFSVFANNQITINTATPITNVALTVFGTSTAATGVYVGGLTSGVGVHVPTITTGTAFSAGGVTTGNGLIVTALSSGIGLNAGGANSTTARGLLFNTNGAGMTTASAVAVSGSASMTADYTGAFINVNPTRNVAAAATRNHSGNMMSIAPIYSNSGAVNAILNITGTTTNILRTINAAATGATAAINATAPVFAIGNIKTGNGTTTDSAILLDIDQYNPLSTGTLLSVMNWGQGNLATFTGNGNFGIGTLNPLARLSVSGLSGSTQSVFDVASSTGDSFFTVLASGNVGIGTTTPGSRLDLWQSIAVSDVDMFRIGTDVGSPNNVVFRIDSDGDIFTDGATTIGSPADIAESYSAMEAVDAGTVVAFATSTTVAWSSTKGSATSTASSTDIYEIAGIRKAHTQFEAIGIVSTRPGLHLGADIVNGVPVAMSGRVPVKVTAENGLVKRGDYLTVSLTRPGYAMKLTGEGKAIGRALSDYTTSNDKVMVFIENGYQKVDMAGNAATTTGMLTTGNVNLNANGVAIFNIKSLASANGTWSIDENGRIIAKILCLEDVCIDKTQLANILNSTGQGNGSQNTEHGTQTGNSGGTGNGTTTPEGQVAGTSTESTPEGVGTTPPTETPTPETPPAEPASAPAPAPVAESPSPEEPGV